MVMIEETNPLENVGLEVGWERKARPREKGIAGASCVPWSAKVGMIPTVELAYIR